MSRAMRILMAAVSASFLVAGCEKPQPVKPAAAPATPARAPAAARPLKPNWPPMAAGQADKVSGSKNLFAQNYYVVLDASGSMKESGCSGGKPKIDVARSALADFAARVPADANLGLQVFDDDGIRERMALGVGNRDQFRQALQNVRASGGTPLNISIRQGYQKLTEQAMKQFGYGEYHLVIVTDGEASTGYEPGPVVDQIIRDSPVVLHTIGFCIGTNHSLNQPGRVLYRAADNPEQLKQGLGDVLAEAPVFNAAKFK
jgi:hypothetical protein